jgi:inosine-uridine nucleoside N-ribohydrolase
MPFGRRYLVLFIALGLAAAGAPAQTQPAGRTLEKIIIDTDVGDDVDDAFAIDLALASPEFEILGISTAWGDTALRAQMVDRMLCETGRQGIAVTAGLQTTVTSMFTQAIWAREGISRRHRDAVAFLLDQIKAHPGEITLVALGPLSNIGAAIDRDPATFRRLKRVVLMGGSIHRGYDKSGSTAPQPPEPEYNIDRDPKAAQKLMASGVPIFMLPLDSTQVKFVESKRAQLATVNKPMTNSLLELVKEWSHGTGKSTETLFDAVAMAYALDASTCPMTPVHIKVDDKGMTKPTSGAPNAQACLEPHEEAFFNLLMPRLMQQKLGGTEVCVSPSR